MSKRVSAEPKPARSAKDVATWRRAEHKRRVESALKRALKVHAKNLTALDEVKLRLVGVGPHLYAVMSLQGHREASRKTQEQVARKMRQLFPNAFTQAYMLSELRALEADTPEGHCRHMWLLSLYLRALGSELALVAYRPKTGHVIGISGPRRYEKGETSTPTL